MAVFLKLYNIFPACSLIEYCSKTVKSDKGLLGMVPQGTSAQGLLTSIG